MFLSSQTFPTNARNGLGTALLTVEVDKALHNWRLRLTMVYSTDDWGQDITLLKVEVYWGQLYAEVNDASHY